MDPPVGHGLTADLCLKPAPRVFAVPVGDGAVIVDLRIQRAHAVNLTAAAVWACVDGRTSGGDIAEELASIFGVRARDILDEVLDTLARFRQLAIVTVVDPAVEPDVGDEPRRCTDPAAVERRDGRVYLRMGTTPCIQQVDALGWGPVVALAVGDHRVGVRGNDEAAADLVRRVFAPVVVDDRDVDVNFSVVVLDGRAGGSAHPRQGIYEGHLFVREQADRRALFEVLARVVAARVPAAPGTVCLAAASVAGPAGALVVPDAWLTTGVLDDLGSQPGWHLRPGPTWVDTTTGTVVGDPTAGMMDPAALDELGPAAAPLPDAPCVAVLVDADAQVESVTRVTGIQAAVAVLPRLVAAPAHDPDELLPAAAAFTQAAQVVAVPRSDRAEVVAALVGG